MTNTNTLDLAFQSVLETSYFLPLFTYHIDFCGLKALGIPLLESELLNRIMVKSARLPVDLTGQDPANKLHPMTASAAKVSQESANLTSYNPG